MANTHSPQSGSPAEKRDGILDLQGTYTEIRVDKKLVIVTLVSVAVFFLCQLIDLSSYGPTTAKALGLVLAILIFMIFSGAHVMISTLLIVILGIALGFWDMSVVNSTFGPSPFLPTIGMMVVALGCEFTPFGRRIAYWFLMKLGDRPVRIACVIALVSCLISAFVSNVATLIMMSSITASILEAMDEKPGKSVLGRTTMVMIPVFSLFGGAALISGSPNGNNMAIMFMTKAAGIETGVSYANWAAIGFPSVLLCAPLMCLIYVKYFGLKTENANILPKTYYQEKMRELGPFGGSEIRWVLTVIGMVTCMISGMNQAVSALLFAMISILPAVGTVPAEKVFKRLPFGVTLAMSLLPLMGILFSRTGLGDLVTVLLRPVIGGMGPVALCIFSGLVMGILVNVFLNAQMAASALVLSVITPVCVSMGYNPAVVMLPSMMIASFFFCFGMNSTILMNSGYGYWDMKDFTIPGFLSIVIIAVLFGLFACLVSPLIGIPLTL